MRNLFLILLCVVVANARWSGYHARQNAASEDLDWWENGVFYQIYPRSFKDSDGDGVGDIRGIIESLEHLKDLGVEGFWLGPVFESSMFDGGYDIINYRKVDPIFGTNDDLKELFAKAKELGLKALIDFVPNHTSDQHSWFALSAARYPGFEDLYLWRNCQPQADGSRSMPNNWIGVYHTPTWSYNAIRDQCYLHHYSPEQPDLNLRHEGVYNETLNIVRFWLEEGADGFRIDAVRLFENQDLSNELILDINGDRSSRDNLIHFNTVNQPESFAFIRDVRSIIDDFIANSTDKSSKILLTDTYAPVTQQVQWYGESETEPGSQVPMNYALLSALNADSNAIEFRDALEDLFDFLPGWGVPNYVLGNHDVPRIAYRFGEDRHESLAILSLMLPGTNIIYYGEEIGMTDNRNIALEEADDPMRHLMNETIFMQLTRDPARTPFQWDDSEWAGFSNTNESTWLPIHPNYVTVNLKAQKEAEKSTYKLYKSLIEMRRNRRVLQIGGFESTAVNDQLFGFIRTLVGHHTIAVLVNLASETTNTTLRDFIGYEYQDQLRGRVLIVNNNSTVQIGSSISDNQVILFGPYDALVLEISSASKLAVSLLLIVMSLTKFIL